MYAIPGPLDLDLLIKVSNIYLYNWLLKLLISWYQTVPWLELDNGNIYCFDTSSHKEIDESVKKLLV